MKDFLKRLVATIGIITAVFTLFGGVVDFREATNALDVFKALFWMLIGGAALAAFIDDFREKKWPFEG